MLLPRVLLTEITERNCFRFSLQEVYELKRNEHLNELQRKEDEMRQMFVLRVKDKEGELKKSEKEVSRRAHLSKFTCSLRKMYFKTGFDSGSYAANACLTSVFKAVQRVRAYIMLTLGCENMLFTASQLSVILIDASKF